MIVDRLRLPGSTEEPTSAMMVEKYMQALPKLIGDGHRLQHVLINLLKNAVKFTLRGQIKIKVCYQDSESLLIVRVEDTGFGITN